MRGRPNLYTDYRKESAVLPNLTQKFWFVVLLFFAFSLCLIASDYWILLLTTSFLIAVLLKARQVNLVSNASLTVLDFLLISFILNPTFNFYRNPNV